MVVDALLSRHEQMEKQDKESQGNVGHSESTDSFALNTEQENLRQLFREYLKTGDKSKVPPVTLLHGRAGTGKTAVIKRILADAEKFGRKTIRTAFNVINVIAMRGTTTCPLCFVHAKVHAKEQQPLSSAAFKRISAEAEGAFILIVEKISNFPPHMRGALWWNSYHSCW